MPTQQISENQNWDFRPLPRQHHRPAMSVILLPHQLLLHPAVSAIRFRSAHHATTPMLDNEESSDRMPWNSSWMNTTTTTLRKTWPFPLLISGRDNRFCWCFDKINNHNSKKICRLLRVESANLAHSVKSKSRKAISLKFSTIYETIL